MKKTLQILCLFFFVFLLKANAKNVETYFNYCTFNIPGEGPYLETYLSVIGNSLEYVKMPNNKLKAQVEITIVIKEKDKVIDFKKFILSSPEVSDSTQEFPNFIDLQRFSIPNGSYEMEVEIIDLNNKTEKQFMISESVLINYLPNEILFSDIQLIESYTKTEKPNILTKSGYDLVPYVSYFYPKTLKNITFYAEIYNTLKVLGIDEKFVVSYFIETAESNIKFSNYNIIVRKTSSEVIIVFGNFNIEKLPSGNYNLVIETRNKENELISSKKVIFQRSNKDVEFNEQDIANIRIEESFVSKMTNQDTLAEHIRSLRPISSQLEKTFADNQLRSSDLEFKQKFFFNFWNSRNPVNPEQAWLDYYKIVKSVDKSFGSKLKKGYSTDRGRVFLQYGAPNTISQQYNEPSAYPYEVWHYYHIEKFNNRKFVFYNPDLGTNDFPLLHSDLFGEINNPRWQLMLHKRNHQVLDLDMNSPDSHYGGNSEELFQLPR
ncbi:MAG: GWxTD domain-containing protein [Bacteroidetes bacterium]|nr:GWxTD domain-containing protein [Bacteroidota bacterium]HET6244058.1 GWxTD domain-containing protein [Bacteroidia bacterium]